MTCLGGANGSDGPGGIALLDHDTFDVLRQWETDRGPQYLAYDAWWHLNQNTLISSEWGTPSMIEDGLVPELLLENKYGHAIHFWDLATGKHRQRVDLGAQHQMPLELRPSHDPEATWGFLGVVISTEDLSASVWRWHRDGDSWAVDKVITIPAEPADPDLLPPALKPFGAVPPLVSDIDLSVDDKFLYVSCWGIGNSNSSTCTTQPAPRPGPSGSEGSWATAPIRQHRTSRCPVAHRWSRSAVMVPGLPHQLPLRRLGRPVLPGRGWCLDGRDARRS